MTNGTVQQIAEKIVGEYFAAFPLETYEGHVTTEEVIEYAFTNTPATLRRYSDAIYDAIRLLGPCGENDVEWLQGWGGKHKVRRIGKHEWEMIV